MSRGMYWEAVRLIGFPENIGTHVCSLPNASLHFRSHTAVSGERTLRCFMTLWLSSLSPDLHEPRRYSAVHVRAAGQVQALRSHLHAWWYPGRGNGTVAFV